MLVAYKGHCNGRDALAVQRKRSLNHGRVALPRDRIVRSSTTFSTHKYFQCAANRHGVFVSPAGCRMLAGGTTPCNRPVFSHPGGSLESVVGHPLRPISRIRPISSRPKSIVDLSGELLIRVDNSLSPTHHKPIIRPENKGIKPKSNRHKAKNFITCSLHKVASECYPLYHQSLFIPNFRFKGIQSFLPASFFYFYAPPPQKWWPPRSGLPAIATYPPAPYLILNL